MGEKQEGCHGCGVGDQLCALGNDLLRRDGSIAALQPDKLKKSRVADFIAAHLRKISRPIITMVVAKAKWSLPKQRHCYPIWSTPTGKLSALIWPLPSLQKQFA
jgi:hypothetical protein